MRIAKVWSYATVKKDLKSYEAEQFIPVKSMGFGTPDISEDVKQGPRRSNIDIPGPPLHAEGSSCARLSPDANA